MAQPAEAKTDFSIEIDFEKGAGSPSRVFRAMSDIIDALQETDRTLIKSIDSKIKPVILLEDVDGGSIKARLAQIIESIDDEGLKKGEYKIIIGNYLVRAKYLIIDFLKGKSNIQGVQEIEQLEKDLFTLAETTDVRALPFYAPVSRTELLADINKINSALEPLNETDKASFVVRPGEEVEFNLTLHIAPETIEELITANRREFVATLILKIKKPDFLGASQWDFRHGKDSFTAKMLDETFLDDFHERRVVLSPGDAIEAIVHTEVLYGFDNEVVITHNSVEKVLSVIKGMHYTQDSLLDE